MKVSKSGAGLPSTFWIVSSVSLSVLTIWTLNLTPISCRLLGDQPRGLDRVLRLRARVEAELERHPVLLADPLVVQHPARVVEDLVRLLRVVRVVLLRDLEEGLVELGQDPVAGERGPAAGDRVDPLAVDRVGDRLADLDLLDRRVELGVGAEVRRAEVERELGVGGRALATVSMFGSSARRAKLFGLTSTTASTSPSWSARSTASWVPYLTYWISSKFGASPRNCGFRSMRRMRPFSYSVTT